MNTIETILDAFSGEPARTEEQIIGSIRRGIRAAVDIEVVTSRQVGSALGIAYENGKIDYQGRNPRTPVTWCSPSSRKELSTIRGVSYATTGDVLLAWMERAFGPVIEAQRDLLADPAIEPVVQFEGMNGSGVRDVTLYFPTGEFLKAIDFVSKQLRPIGIRPIIEMTPGDAYVTPPYRSRRR